MYTTYAATRNESTIEERVRSYLITSAENKEEDSLHIHDRRDPLYRVLEEPLVVHLQLDCTLREDLELAPTAPACATEWPRM